MLQAAQEPRTFHGLLARRALGLTPGFAWHGTASEAGAAALAESAGGWRALALLQAGQTARAEAELRALWPAARGNAALAGAMLAVASRAGMTNSRRAARRAGARVRTAARATCSASRCRAWSRRRASASTRRCSMRWRGRRSEFRPGGGLPRRGARAAAGDAGDRRLCRQRPELRGPKARRGCTTRRCRWKSGSATCCTGAAGSRGRRPDPAARGL